MDKWNECSSLCNWVRLNVQYALLYLRCIIPFSFFSARGHAGSGVAIKGLSLSRKHCLAIEGKAARWYK